MFDAQALAAQEGMDKMLSSGSVTRARCRAGEIALEPV